MAVLDCVLWQTADLGVVDLEALVKDADEPLRPIILILRSTVVLPYAAQTQNWDDMNENAAAREQLVKIVWDYHAKVRGWIVAIWGKEPDDNYERSDDFKAAMDFYRQFKSQPDAHYDTALEYARDLYDRCERTDKSHDEKADSIIKYLGGGSALVTFGALLSIKPDNPTSALLGLTALLLLLPSMVCATLAIMSAINVRLPKSAATLPPVEFAVKMGEYYKTADQTKLNVWLILHPLCEAYHHRNHCKSYLVSKAHRWYQRAVAGLLLPAFGMVAVLGWLVVGGWDKIQLQSPPPTPASNTAPPAPQPPAVNPVPTK